MIKARNDRNGANITELCNLTVSSFSTLSTRGAGEIRALQPWASCPGAGGTRPSSPGR